MLLLALPKGAKIIRQRIFWGAAGGALAGLLWTNSPLLSNLELSMLEWQYQVANQVTSQAVNNKRPANNEIAIVAFDDSSQFDSGITRFNDLSSQTLLAKVLDRIEEAKPSLIAVDLDLRGSAAPNLVNTFRHYRNVVLALFGTFAANAALPAAEFIDHAAGYGYGDLTREANGMVCRLPINYDRKSHKRASGLESVTTIPSFTEAIVDEHRQFKGVGADSDFLRSQADKPLYINFKNKQYDQTAFVNVLSGNFNPQLFKDKIVLIGSTLTSRLDEQPYMRTPLKLAVPDVLIEADALSTILGNKIIASFPKGTNSLLVVLLGILLGGLSAMLPMRKRFLLFVFASIAVFALSQLAFQFFYLAPPVVPWLAVCLSAFILGTLIYLDTDLRMSNLELANARQSMQARAEEERKRIAEDLHDETLPALSTVARLADRIALEVPDSPLPKQMRTQLDDALEEMRRVINDLHPSVLETMGFLPALENLLNMAAADSNIETRYLNKITNNLELSEFTKLQLYRIVQEALNNVKKHANATIVELSIAKVGDNLEISVSDNGKGIDDTAIKKGFNSSLETDANREQSPPLQSASAQHGSQAADSNHIDSHGLVNIKQRAQLIGATVNWQKPKQFAGGLQVALNLPLKLEDQTGNLP